MEYITDKEIAKLLGITEKSYLYQSKTKERIDVIIKELTHRVEKSYELRLNNYRNDVINAVKSVK